MRRALMVVFFLFIFLLWDNRMVTAQFSEAGVEQFKVAVDAPDFRLKDLGGGKISLKELRGEDHLCCVSL